MNPEIQKKARAGCLTFIVVVTVLFCIAFGFFFWMFGQSTPDAEIPPLQKADIPKLLEANRTIISLPKSANFFDSQQKAAEYIRDLELHNARATQDIILPGYLKCIPEEANAKVVAFDAEKKTAKVVFLTGSLKGHSKWVEVEEMEPFNEKLENAH